MKTCTKCKIELSLDSFRKDITKKDGLRPSCKKCSKIYDINYCKENEEKRKEYRDSRKEAKKEYDINYKKRRKELRKTIKPKKIIKKEKEINYVSKFKVNVRNLIKNSFKRNGNNYKKRTSSETILGCTIQEFKVHIESKFTEGMSFDNHGDWHLDHIIPLAFAKTEESIILLNHHTNFQPLWAVDNLRKGRKV